MHKSPAKSLLCLLLALGCAVQASETVFDGTFVVGAGADGAVNGLVVDSLGNVWVGGEFQVISGQTNPYLARLNPGGAVISPGEFPTDGPVHRLALQPDGKILAAGSFVNLQGTARSGLARLNTNGLLDLDFNPAPALGTNTGFFTLAVQPDGKILTATEFDNTNGCRVFRLLSTGEPDPDFHNTNIFAGQVYCFASGPSNTILVGGIFIGYNARSQSALALMQSNGLIVSAWNNQLDFPSSVFALGRLSNSSIMVGGNLKMGSDPQKRLMKLAPELSWDTNYVADAFDAASGVWNSSVTAVLPQSDGGLVLGGSFHEVGGYYRRHLVRLNDQGRVDGCFDPGLGLGGDNQVRSLAQQTDGRIVVGGSFEGVDGMDYPHNLARIHLQSGCNLTRVYLLPLDPQISLVLGIFPPGKTNYLERSTNLLDWITINSRTNYVLDHFEPSGASAAFFRVRQSTH